MNNYKNILITGGNGYITKSLQSKLSADYAITVVTRRDFDLVDSKATMKYFEQKYYDVVIHTAIVGGSRLKSDSREVVDQNLMMYYNLVSNEKSFGKLITFGSGAELHAKDTPYGQSKAIIRNSILTRTNYYNLRIFGVFDENELNTRFIKSNIKRYIERKPMKIHQDKFMDFIYMDDLVEVVKLYIEHDNLAKEINCAESQTHRLSEIADIINNLSDYRVTIQYDQSGLANDYVGWLSGIVLKDWIGLEEGIKRVYNKLKTTK